MTSLAAAFYGGLFLGVLLGFLLCALLSTAQMGAPGPGEPQ